MSIGGGGGDEITLHKITQCADIKRKKNMDPDSLKMRSGQFKGQKSLGPLKMSLEMAHKVIVPQKNYKIMSRSFLNSGTLIVILYLQ
jgi:hypothetical protein